MPVATMPAVLDWTLDPLAVIDQIYEDCQGGEQWISKTQEYFNNKLENETSLNKVACVPETPLDQLQDGQLVRFRCQVQDQYEPEYFVESYEVEIAETGVKKTRSSRYRELLSCRSGERVVSQSATDSISERCVTYCISLPGQNAWVTQAVQNQQPTPSVPEDRRQAQGGLSGPCKRSLEDDTNNEDEDRPQGMDTEDQQTDESSKRARVANSAPSTNGASGGGQVPPSYNLPLPDPNAMACLVKFYSDNEEQFPLNHVVEVVGIVCLDPTLPAVQQEDEEGENGDCSAMQDTRGPACKLPPSLVPRLHAIWWRPLPHNNPLLPLSPPSLPSTEARESRELLRSVLEEACLGDPLAGDFLIACLLGNVYTRQDLATLGQFPLNISGITPSLSSAGFTTKLYTLLQQLCSHSHLMPLTTQHLNTATFIPKKDYNTNELRSGGLQLPRHTLLMLDETVMESGQLTAPGLRNLEQIGNILRNQKCKYDFQFHNIELDTNINALVLSEGRSMLPCDSELVLNPQHVDVEAAHNRVQEMLTEDALDRIRRYITVARLASYELTSSMQEELQSEFVAARQESRNGMTPEAFHRLLVLARLVSMSCGEHQLTQDVWKSCKILENTREQRIAALNRPPPPSARPLVGAL